MDIVNQGGRISVVIPTCSRYDALENTIADLLKQTETPSRIIVIDTTAATERRKPAGLDSSESTEILYIASDAFGKVNRARNEGLRLVTSEFVLLLDDDMQLPPDCLAGFLRAHAEGVEVVHGSLIQSGAELESSHGGDRPLWNVLRHRHAARRCHTIAVSSGFVSIRTEALRAIGYLDEAFLYSYDDWDLGYRLWTAGYITIHEPRIFATHLKVSQGGARALVSGKQGQLNKFTAKYYFLAKHFSGRAVRIEFLTDLLLAFAERKRRPWTLLSEWGVRWDAYRRFPTYGSQAHPEV
ncbi:MAG: glycosyltransferase family 2 protein [Gemmatimonadaceae bacterium]